MKVVIVTALFLLCLIVGTQAATIAATFSDLASKAKSAKAGDIRTFSNVIVSLAATGSASAPVTISGYGVTVKGISAFSFSGKYVVVEGLTFADGYTKGKDLKNTVEFRDQDTKDCSYCTLRNVTIKNFNPPSLATDYKYNSVVNCTFLNKNHMGTTVVVWRDVTKEDHHYIGYNTFIGRIPILDEKGKPENGQEAIRIGESKKQGASFTVVEYNTLIDQNGEIELVSSKSYNNTFRYNTFIRSQGAITLRHAEYNQVYGNKFLGGGLKLTSGVRVCWGEGHLIYNNYFEALGNPEGSKLRGAIIVMNGDNEQNTTSNGYRRVRNITIAHNTMRDCYVNLVIGSNEGDDGPIAPANVIVANNIIVSDEDPIVKYIKTPTNIRYTDNIGFGSATQPTYSGWTNVDPKFATSSGYRLASSSPAINAASGYSWIATDIDGKRRGTTRDIGASEFAADSTSEPVTTASASTSSSSSSSSSSTSSSSTTSSNPDKCRVSKETFTSSVFTAQTKPFEFTFKAIPSTATVDAVFGLSLGAPASYADLSVAVKFDDEAGRIYVYKNKYTSDAVYTYSAGVSYFFSIRVNVAAATYNVSVGTTANNLVVIATEYPFRKAASQISSYSIITGSSANFDNAQFCNITRKSIKL